MIKKIKKLKNEIKKLKKVDVKTLFFIHCYSSLFNDYKRNNEKKIKKSEKIVQKTTKFDFWRFFLEDEIVRSSTIKKHQKFLS